MSRQKILKLIHLASTVWFVLCIGYILVLALRQAGAHWWIIFSLSAHSALLVFLLISLYLFAVFRGASGCQKIEIEHPLTSTDYYTVFYFTAPFLGGLAGILGTIGENRVSQFLLGVALGTMGATFLVWVIVDPVIGLLETILPPKSRKHRTERLAQAKVERAERQKERERFLAEVLAKDKSVRCSWQQVLKPEAEKLAEMLMTDKIDFEQATCDAIDIGVSAWQIGGLEYMQELRSMAIDICRNKHGNLIVSDYISNWWDGIGNWRRASVV